VIRISACVAFCKPLLIHLFEKDPGITVTESWVDGTQHLAAVVGRYFYSIIWTGETAVDTVHAAGPRIAYPYRIRPALGGHQMAITHNPPRLLPPTQPVFCIAVGIYPNIRALFNSRIPFPAAAVRQSPRPRALFRIDFGGPCSS
jgi:hypothetical protein